MKKSNSEEHFLPTQHVLKNKNSDVHASEKGIKIAVLNFLAK